MKKKIFLAILFTSFFNLTHAQKDTTHHSGFTAIKTDLTSLPANMLYFPKPLTLTLERGFSNRYSVQLTTGFTTYVKPYMECRTLAWIIMPEFKIFFKKKGFKGIYAGVYAFYKEESIEEYWDYFKSHSFLYTAKVRQDYQKLGAGLSLGFQTYSGKHFTVDVLLGCSWVYVTRNTSTVWGDHYFEEYYDADNTYPLYQPEGRVALNLGYKF